MALCHLPSPPLFTSRELQPVPSVSRLAEERLRWDSLRSPSCTAPLLACSARKPRGSRKSKTTKSNADLCNELREFVWAMGLPEDHVPSTKELLQHGRKDLAYIVRSRGHKKITKLLINPTNVDTTTEKGLANDRHFGKVSTEESIEGQETQDNIYNMPEESLLEGATSYSQNSELEITGDSLEREDAVIHNGYKFSSNLHNADGGDDSNIVSQLASPLTSGQSSSRSIDNISALQLLDELELSFRDNVLVEEIPGSSDFGEKKASDLAEENANQADANRLKELLRQKEMELAFLKQQIEEEKFALTMMQNKAQSEISKVQNIISTKDKELHAAEESLSGLKEVLIEYWGNGETVDVAGSFNGWQHRINMDSQTSANPNGVREGVLWSTILWLYPGIYEIKFVVDGHWKIDAQREFVARGTITNNVLRVER